MITILQLPTAWKNNVWVYHLHPQMEVLGEFGNYQMEKQKESYIMI